MLSERPSTNDKFTFKFLFLQKNNCIHISKTLSLYAYASINEKGRRKGHACETALTQSIEILKKYKQDGDHEYNMCVSLP